MAFRVTRRRLALALLSLLGAFGALAPLASAAESEFLSRGMPYAAFDRLKAQRIDIGDAVIEVAFAPGELNLSEREVLDWVSASARIVAGYYGRFPASRTRLLVLPTDGASIHGTTYAYHGAAIKLPLGDSVTIANTARDWVLIHEMTHLAFPEVPRRHHWIEEGLATYVEPVARAQAGQLSADDVWLGLMRGLPQGLPQAGDRGLDNTPTWGRTYWGGALFSLLADVEIRSRTTNRFGLQQALRAILDKTGGMRSSVPLEEALKIGDAAVGVPVLSELYARMKDAPHEVDLEDLWKRLGVHAEGRVLRYDDEAPLAAVRRAITAQVKRVNLRSHGPSLL